MPEHDELRHARWRPRLPERGTWRRGARVKRGHGDAEAGGGTGLRDATTARPASWASRNSSPPVMDAQTEGKQRQERRREARKERRTSMPGIVLDERRGRQAEAGSLAGLLQRALGFRGVAAEPTSPCPPRRLFNKPAAR